VDMTNPALTITAPTGGSYSGAGNVTVNWTIAPTQSSGEYGVWLYNGVTWYFSQLLAAPATSASVALGTIPQASGYYAVVAWRPNVGTGDFVSWGTSSGSFTITP
jgi:hypothetical protein